MPSRRPALALTLLAACTAPPPEPEIIRYQPPPELAPSCDGHKQRPCYHGPAGTENVGRCRAGVERCTAKGWTGTCDGEALPRAETCSTDDDDDCDGANTCQGTLLWARNIVGGGQDTGGVYGGELSAFAVDAKGRMWLAGSFAGKFDLNGLVLRSDAREDNVEPYLARLDEHGTHPAPGNLGRTFGRAVGGRDEHRVQDLHIAADGDLYLLLWTNARVEFGGLSAGSAQRPNVLAHLGPDGAPRRLVHLPLGQHDLALRFTLGPDALAVTGLSDNHGTILGPDDRGSFVLALDRAHLRKRWRVDLAQGFSYSRVAAIADDFLVSGQFTGELALGNTKVRCAAQYCAGLARLDPQGGARWLRSYGTTGSSTIDALIVDDLGIALTGGAQQIDLGGGDLGLPDGLGSYVARLDPDANHLWSRYARNGGRLTVRTLAPAPDGALYLGGEFSDILRIGDFVLGGGRRDQSPTCDVFVARYTRDGTVDWAQYFGGPSFQEIGGLAFRPADSTLVLAGSSSAEFKLGDTAITGRVFLAAIKP